MRNVSMNLGGYEEGLWRQLSPELSKKLKSLRVTVDTGV